MDAEIGVRNLADSFRYNSLANVAEAIGFDITSYKKRIEYSGIESLDDLPDYEQLVWLVHFFEHALGRLHANRVIVASSSRT
jgi:hypothetical protein